MENNIDRTEYAQVPTMLDVLKYRELRQMFSNYVYLYIESKYPNINFSIDSWVMGSSFLTIDWYNEDTDTDEETSVMVDEFLEWCETI